MAAELVFGSVPPFYRELYDIICPNQELQVDRDIFVKLLVKSSLPSQTLCAIWDLVDNKQGFLTRIGLYKALMLTAMAQQGKQINAKLLESFSGPELPKPMLGDLSDLKSLGIRLRREQNPTRLGISYQELCEMNTIHVDIMPEKKGLFLKHVEYEVRSERCGITVRRRYNDFCSLHELLLIRFPYRMIPRLPPKKMMGGDAEFIEERRRALKRYLILVCRHPIVAEDKIVNFFFTFTGHETQSKMRDNFKNMPDEYVTSDLAAKSKDLVPLDTHIQFANSREHLKQVATSINHLKDIVDKMVARSKAHSLDMTEFGKELSLLGTERIESAWANGGSETWIHLKKGLKNISKSFSSVADRLTDQANKEEETVAENLNLLIDMLNAYKDLCDRQEKGVLQDHQRAQAKMLQIKKKMVQASMKTPDQSLTDQIESRIIEQESQILNMENRNYFSLHCIHMETQLVHTNMEILYEVVQNLVDTQATSYTDLGKLWEQFRPLIENLLSDASKSPTNSRPTSPVSDIPMPLLSR